MKKKQIKNKLQKKLQNKLIEIKKSLSEKILKEAEEVAAPEEPVVKDLSINTAKFRVGTNDYRYQFSGNNRIYVVDFKSANDPMKYYVSFYVKGFQNSDKSVTRFGISSINQIKPVITEIFKVINKFLKERKPLSLRFVSGYGIEFPSIFHQYIFEILQEFKSVWKSKYTIFRGSDNGAAFSLRRGGTEAQIKSRTWRPGVSAKSPASKSTDANKAPVNSVSKLANRPASSAAIAQTSEEIVNVGGAGVATDIPFKGNCKKKKVQEAVTGPTRNNIQKMIDALNSIKTARSKMISDVEKSFKIKNLKLDSQGKVLSFDSSEWISDPLL